jgi:hypothetical protein
MHYARFPEGDQIRHVQYICSKLRVPSWPEH